MEVAARRNRFIISLLPFGRRRITLITYSVIQPIFLQINIAHDLSRRGFVPGEIEEIVSHAASMTDAVRLDGLMTITPIYEEPEGVRKDYRQMNELREVLRAKGLDNTFYNGRILLSMGMSADYEIAVEEGSDIVRVGAALFGERQVSTP